jgi:hypothetical protein
MGRSKPDPSFRISAGEIHGDVRGRDIVAAVAESGAHPVAAFAHGGVGQTHGVKVVFIGLDAGDVDLNFDDAGVDTVNGGTEGLVEHGWQ